MNSFLITTNKTEQSRQQQTKTVANSGSISSDNSPFRTSGKVGRSPPTREIPLPAQTSNQQTVEQSEETVRATELERTVRGNSKVDSVAKLGKKISQLLDFIKPRTNIHKDIHSMMREIHALYLVASSDVRAQSDKSSDEQRSGTHSEELISKGSQTDEDLNALEIVKTPKRKRDPKTLSPRDQKPKRRKNVTPKKLSNGAMNTEPIAESAPTTSSTDEKSSSNDWTEVRPKQKRGKIVARPARPRPDALLIKACGEVSYADILRKVKGDTTLRNLGQNIKGIRKTEKGELLLELNKPAHQNTSEFRLTVEKVLGTVAEVRALSHEVVVEIRDIDEITTKEEVHEALMNVSEDLKSLQNSAIKSMRRAYGGTQIATVGLCTNIAKRLLETGKIRIGWVVCRIREKVAPKRCYKCLDYGHAATKCKGQDNSAKCIKCGESGHKISACKNKPSCILCNRAERTVYDHVTGGVACPYYRKALESLRSRK